MNTDINTPIGAPRYALFVGVDRSDATIDTETLDAAGSRACRKRISTRPEALLEWAGALRERAGGGRVALCIEAPCANIASFLRQFDFIDIFPVNPLLIKSYRESFHTARSKDDKKDAACIARFVFERHASLEVWRPASAEMRQLRAYLEHRRSLVDAVTKATNQLTAALKLYYPQALELSGKRLDAPLACRFLEKFPDLATLEAASPGQLRAFYYANKCCRKALVEERVAAAGEAVAITSDEGVIAPQRELALFLVRQIDLLRPQIARYDALVADIMAAHEDAAIFEALPGAGPNLSARLLATFGDDRTRYPEAGAIQRYSGIAPVTRQSGNKRHVHRRFTKRTCPHFTLRAPLPPDPSRSEPAEPAEGWLNFHRVGWPDTAAPGLGARLLRRAARQEGRPLVDHTGAGLQVDPHPPPLLDRPPPLRRSALPERPAQGRQPYRLRPQRGRMTAAAL